MVMAKKLKTVGYTYAKLSLKSPPDIVYTLIYIRRLSTWTSSRLDWALALRAKEQHLNRLRPSTVFTKKKQLGGPDRF